ncbi:MAG: hypothetical protein KGH68_02570, partial [Patescibacteria group bacterium]|nr:hypothetical protein [Patescibacteria group bacterium]
ARAPRAIIGLMKARLVSLFSSKTYIVSAALFLALLIPAATHAGTQDNLTGYAWSSNIGWVSLNCTNTNSCNSVDYGVNMNADGTLTGYAWSSNIGWIQFGGLSGFPNGNGTQSKNAEVDGNNLKGWARALSNDSSWDGWISLSGAGYGPTLSGSSFSGYAWGSNVVGWISFSGSGSPDYGVTLAGTVALDAQISGSSISGNTNVPYASNVSIVWTLTNMPGGTTCVVSKTSSGGTSFNTVSNITSSGSTQTGSLSQASYTYQIQCSNGGNVTNTATVSFTVLPQPPGFVITGPNTLQVQFLNQNGATTQSGTYFVDNGGTPFNNPVTISVQGISPALPPKTTATYSFNGGPFSSNPTPVTIHSPYTTGVSLQVEFNKNIGNTQYTVTLQGTGSGAPDATMPILISPVGVNPSFQEY